MTRIILGLAALAGIIALAGCAPAFAGSLSISATTGSNVCPTLTPPVGGTAITQCITGADSQFARLVTAYKALLSLDEAATNAQTFQALAKAIFGKIKADVQSYEQGAAAASASDGVQPVAIQ